MAGGEYREEGQGLLPRHKALLSGIARPSSSRYVRLGTHRAAENKVPSAVRAQSQCREWYPITATSSHCYIRAQCYTRMITLIIIQDHTRLPSRLHQRENLPVNIGRDEDIASGHDNICLSDPCSSNRLRTDWCLLGQYLHYFCIY